MRDAISMPQRPTRRGQATVELALSLILFIVIIAGGIHFAELGMLAVKATEASSAALWDVSGRLPHAYDDDKLQVRHSQAASQAQERIAEQYENYDGRESVSGPAPSLVFTRAGRMTVECSEAGNDIFDQMEMGPLGGVYFERNSHNGVQCRASATASIIPGQAPQSVFENEGWLKGPVLENSQITFCGVGRAWGGRCNQGTPMLVGEWALMDPNSSEARECDVYAESNCANPGYYNAVKAYFDRIGNRGELGSLFARLVAMRGSPVDEDKFWFSFKGSESNFLQNLRSTYVGERAEFAVTPGGKYYESLNHYERIYNERSDCWLGLPCNVTY